MLTIFVGGDELWDEKSEEFVTANQIKIELEHSLVSLSKWEEIFEKPFLGAGEKSDEEILAYISAMIITPDFPPEVLSKLSQKNLDDVNEYINKTRTATWFVEESNNPKTAEVITSELIYYWMVAFSIPFECQHWHLNRLFTLIRVCNVKNAKPKKMSRAERANKQRQLNAERKAQWKTSG